MQIKAVTGGLMSFAVTKKHFIISYIMKRILPKLESEV